MLARKKRTDNLKKDNEVRLKKIRLASNYYKQLLAVTKCHDDTYNSNCCYVHPKDRKLHYSLSHDQHQVWTEDIARSKATLRQPLTKLYDYLVDRKKSLTRGSFPLKRQNFQQEIC